MGETGLDAWASGLFFGAMVDEEIEEDLDEADEELEEDLDEEHEVEKDETSACTPLPGVPDVVSWITDTGSKGYPLFKFGMGHEGG